MPLFLALAINGLGFTALNSALMVFSLYPLSLGASAVHVGSIIATLYALPLLLSWTIGVLAGRTSPRWLLTGGTAVGACGALVPFLFPGLPSLYVAAATIGLTTACTTVIGQSLIGLLSTPATRTRNFSNYSMMGSISILVGPPLAGSSIDRFGFPATCAVISLLLFIGVAGLLAWGKALPRDDTARRLEVNLMATLRDRRLWGLLAVSAIGQLVTDIFLIFLPMYGHGIGLSATTIGIIVSTVAVGSFSVRLGLVRLVAWFGEARLLAIALFIGAAAFALVPLFRHVAPLCMLALAFGLCGGCTQPLSMLMMFNAAPPGRGGEVIGLRMTGNNLARMAGPALFGGIATATGLLAVFWINSVLMAGGGWWAARRASPGRD
ncbi:MFS transporter [Ramlibacter sp.]|uniref:MFS transporter n=1 Tax=Ramlibacter sp. TaxID=1917967 RepID=UPI003D0AA640